MYVSSGCYVYTCVIVACVSSLERSQFPPHTILIVHLKHCLDQNLLPLTLLPNSVIQFHRDNLTTGVGVLCSVDKQVEFAQIYCTIMPLGAVIIHFNVDCSNTWIKITLVFENGLNLWLSSCVSFILEPPDKIYGYANIGLMGLAFQGSVLKKHSSESDFHI